MKRQNFLLLLYVLIPFLSFNSCSNNALYELETESILKNTYLPNNWLASISDNVLLSNLSIPGTHESCAMTEPWPGTATCQSLTIGEQLEAGTRFLDIRCRHIDDAFAIHHGSIYQNMNFDDVLAYCWEFLADNPTETIIMSVKEEYNSDNITQSFEETFLDYVAKNPSGWYTGSTVPSLGNARGKIVLFRRFSMSSSYGLAATPDWQDDATFWIYHYTTFRVQDEYYVSDGLSDKWDAISALFGEANTGSSSHLYVNYTSGYEPLIFGIPSITNVSNYINPLVSSYFTTNTSGRFGIIPMDFATEACNTLIIDTNF